MARVIFLTIFEQQSNELSYETDNCIHPEYKWPQSHLVKRDSESIRDLSQSGNTNNIQTLLKTASKPQRR